MTTIRAMPEVLSWRADGQVLRAVSGGYTELLADHLGALLADVQREDAATAADILGRLRALPDASFQRFLCAPETSCRLLWNAGQPPARNAVALLRALRAEAARLDPPSHDTGAEALWSSNGDFCLRSDGGIYHAPLMAGVLPLDFDSPWATTLDFNGRADVTLCKRIPIEASERGAILARLDFAAAQMRQTGHGVLDMVLGFTKVLILQRDPEAPTMFATGSSGQYIGRSVFSNPQLAPVDEVELAEGLVHEAIHALLYMQERRQRWVPTELYDTTIRALSPWTGNPLPLRPYLQACFVWYGLLHFWALALDSNSFAPWRARERMAQCASGFVDPRFHAPLRRYREAIDADLLTAIEAMADAVRATAMAVAE
jgi:hypothetical protein